MNENENKKELTVEEERALMNECLEKAIGGQVGIFLTEAVFDGEGNITSERDCDSRLTDKCRPILRFTRDYVFLDLEFTGGAIDMQSIEYLFNKYLDKNTESILKNTGHEFFYNINIVGTQDAETYMISLVNPCFMGQQGEDKINFSIPLENMSFNKLTANLKTIDAAIEYEHRMEEDLWEDILPEQLEQKFEDAGLTESRIDGLADEGLTDSRIDGLLEDERE